MRAFKFTIDLAALASRREYLNLEKWLTANIQTHGNVFLRALLDFIVEKRREREMVEGSHSIPLSTETLMTFQNVLQVNAKYSFFSSFFILFLNRGISFFFSYKE